MIRHISGPTLKLLDQADLRADEIDAAIEGLVWGKAAAVLRHDHPLILQLRQASAINVVQIARRSRNLLIVIEEHGDAGPVWQYREHTRRRCTFSCRGEIPDTIQAALKDELLDKLVHTAIAKSTLISGVTPSPDGWLNVDVVPEWHVF